MLPPEGEPPSSPRSLRGVYGAEAMCSSSGEAHVADIRQDDAPGCAIEGALDAAIMERRPLAGAPLSTRGRILAGMRSPRRVRLLVLPRSEAPGGRVSARPVGIAGIDVPVVRGPARQLRERHGGPGDARLVERQSPETGVRRDLNPIRGRSCRGIPRERRRSRVATRPVAR